MSVWDVRVCDFCGAEITGNGYNTPFENKQHKKNCSWLKKAEARYNAFVAVKED